MELTITDLVVKKVDGIVTVSCGIVDWQGVGDFELNFGEIAITSDDSEVETENFGAFSKGFVHHIQSQKKIKFSNEIKTIRDDYNLCTDNTYNHRVEEVDSKLWRCANCGLMKQE